MKKFLERYKGKKLPKIETGEHRTYYAGTQSKTNRKSFGSASRLRRNYTMTGTPVVKFREEIHQLKRKMKQKTANNSLESSRVDGKNAYFTAVKKNLAESRGAHRIVHRPKKIPLLSQKNLSKTIYAMKKRIKEGL